MGVLVLENFFSFYINYEWKHEIHDVGISYQ